MTDRPHNKTRGKHRTTNPIPTPTFWNTLWNWSVEGRATRTEYWTFAIISSFILFALMVAAIAASDYEPNIVLILAAGIFLVLSQISWVCVFIRRMHDTSRSGAYIIIPIIYVVCSTIYGLDATNSDEHNPAQTYSASDDKRADDARKDLAHVTVSITGIVCLLVTLFLLCEPGTPKRNKYGRPQNYSK